jgi:hypothetical protein
MFEPPRFQIALPQDHLFHSSSHRIAPTL